MKIHIPFGGKFLALHWWTLENGGHLSLAKNEGQLRLLASRVFKDHASNLRIDDLLEMEIVAPSKRISVAVEKAHLQQEIDSFYFEVITSLRDVLEAGLPLPKPFVVCSKYEPEDSYYDVTIHLGCKNCENQISLRGLSRFALYRRFHKKWNDTFQKSPRESTSLVESQAIPAKNEEPLWYAYPDFGHHAKGLELREIDYENMECTEALFFFRRFDPPPGLREQLERQLEEAQEAEKLRTANLWEYRRQKYELEKTHRVSKILRVFGS